MNVGKIWVCLDTDFYYNLRKIIKKLQVSRRIHKQKKESLAGEFCLKIFWVKRVYATQNNKTVFRLKDS